jgi:hypothetical protein
MTYWVEGDWPNDKEDSDEIKTLKRLLSICKKVIDLGVIGGEDEYDLLCDFDEEIHEAELVLFPEDDDPRSMGWVGDDGLP